jgi:hypothetical protein
VTLSFSFFVKLPFLPLVWHQNTVSTYGSRRQLPPHTLLTIYFRRNNFALLPEPHGVHTGSLSKRGFFGPFFREVKTLPLRNTSSTHRPKTTPTRRERAGNAVSVTQKQSVVQSRPEKQRKQTGKKHNNSKKLDFFLEKNLTRLLSRDSHQYRSHRFDLSQA